VFFEETIAYSGVDLGRDLFPGELGIIRKFPHHAGDIASQNGHILIVLWETGLIAISAPRCNPRSRIILSEHAELLCTPGRSLVIHSASGCTLRNPVGSFSWGPRPG
jgi:hypothetical protein